MSRMCIFTDQISRATIFINPQMVRLVRKDEYSQGSRIVFDNDHGVTVAETPQAVVRTLEDAEADAMAGRAGDRTTALLDLRATPTL